MLLAASRALSPQQQPSPPLLPPGDLTPPPEPQSGSLLRRHTTPLPGLPPPPPAEPEHDDDDMVTSTAPARPSAGRLSLSLSALPPLDFSALCSVESAPACASTARRNVCAITRAVSTVRPWLLVSGVEAAVDGALLAQHGATHVVNMAAATAPDAHAPRLHYLSLAASDDWREDLAALLPDTTAAIDVARAERGAALVHCHRGVSRSVAVAAAYLISAEGASAEAAVAEVRRARPVADPNEHFCAALAALAARVRAGLPADSLHSLRPHGLHARARAPVLVPARVTGGPEVVDSGAVWIVARRRRAGFVLVVGPGAGEAAVARGRELVARMRYQEERHEAMFPVVVVGGGRGWRCPVEEIGRERWSAALAARLAAVGSGGSWD